MIFVQLLRRYLENMELYFLGVLKLFTKRAVHFELDVGQVTLQNYLSTKY